MNTVTSVKFIQVFNALLCLQKEVKNKLAQTRKEQLLDACAIVVSELEKIEHDREAALCFLKYLP